MSSPIALTGGDASLKTSLSAYRAAWKAFIVINHLEAFEHTLEPMALSWKVEHKIALFANLRMIGNKAGQTHIGTVNERFISMSILREPYEGFHIVKILERRPHSHDILGLDSIDYRVADMDKAYQTLKTAGAKIAKEENAIHKWLSLRFGKDHEFEAKFMDHSMIEFGLRQLQAAKDDLTEDE